MSTLFSSQAELLLRGKSVPRVYVPVEQNPAYGQEQIQVQVLLCIIIIILYVRAYILDDYVRILQHNNGTHN